MVPLVKNGCLLCYAPLRTMKKALTFCFEQDSEAWRSRLDLGEQGFLLFGEGRDPQTSGEAAGVIKKLKPRAPLLNPTGRVPHSHVGPRYWLLWLGFNSGTKTAGDRIP